MLATWMHTAADRPGYVPGAPALGGQQERLTAARRGRHLHHTLPGVEKLEQAGPWDQPRPNTTAGGLDRYSRVGHDAHGCTPARAQQERRIHPNDAMRADPPDVDPRSHASQGESGRRSWAAALQDRRPWTDRPSDHASLPDVDREPKRARHAAHRLDPGPGGSDRVIHQLVALGLQLLEIRARKCGCAERVGT